MGRKRNPYIQQLRELGISDYERRKIRELEKRLQEKDFYSTIKERNRAFFQEEVGLLELNYQNLITHIKYGSGNVRQVIKEYEEELRAVEQGTTVDIERYSERRALELQELGLPVTQEQVLQIPEMSQKDLNKLLGYEESLRGLIEKGETKHALHKREQIMEILQKYGI